MKTHITRTIAFVMVLLMLISSVPSSVLPVLALGETDATQSDSAESIFDSVTLGKGTVTNTESYLAGATSITNGAGTTIPMVDSSLSPYEPYSTEDENHPFLPGGSAWIDLSKIYYGAPATQNYPITKWSANTSVYNTTGLGKTYGLTYGAGDQEQYAIKDLNLIDEFTWAGSYTANTDADTSNDFISDVHEDASGNMVSENGIINSTDHAVRESSETEEFGNYVQTITSKYPETETESGIEARAYNRYDAMQGKWGITLDKNVKSVTWRPSYVQKYYGTTNTDASHLNNAYLYLTDTPYLYYSTEALDTTKIAISLLIGTPVQTETLVSGSKTSRVETRTYDENGEVVTSGGNVEYVYRWYTITDNAVRPGIDDPSTSEDESNMDASMVPNITVSKIVMEDNNEDDNTDIRKTIKYITEGGYKINSYENTSSGNVPTATGSLDDLDPIALAGDNADSLYVSGSVTGCIDFTQVLPLLMSTSAYEGDTYGNGRQAVQYRIAQIRVDTETEEGKEDSAARINYLYFGPALSTVFTPQTTLGNTVNGGNWQYPMNATNIGDANSIYGEEINVATGSQFGSGMPLSYTNGWNNGEAVSITNTPNDPQKITIDTVGKGDGETINMPDSFPTSLYGDSTGKVYEYTPIGSDEKVQLEVIQDRRGNDYVSVEIPIRKWINVVEDSRKLTFTLEMERSVTGKDANGNTVTLNPSFSLWGNDDGALGAGHSDKGTRYHNETILAVFGTNTTPYMIDNTSFYADLIDETIGQSVVYNGQKTVTLYSVNDNNVFSNNYGVCVDAATGIYYYEKDGKYYTITQMTNDQGNQLRYVLLDENNYQYYYDPSTEKMYSGDGNEVTGTITLSQLTPTYNFTEVSLTETTLRDVCDTEETWVDLLRSPYMLRDNCVLKGDNTTAGITNMVGYVFVTTLRIAVPVGTVISIQNMKAEGNSAGLNSYSSSGEVVRAHDGGTGAQPELTLGEKSEAAAYGPFFQYSSDYTIHDLLDTEWLNGADNQNMQDIVNSDVEQTIYGVPYKKTNHDSTTYPYQPIYDYPIGVLRCGSLTSSNPKDFTDANGIPRTSNQVGAIASNTIVTAYGRITLNQYVHNVAKEGWLLIGWEDGYAWIREWWENSEGTRTTYLTSQSSNTQLAFDNTYSSVWNGYSNAYDVVNTRDTLLAKLRDNWVISNFSDNSSDTATVAQAYNSSANIPGLRGVIDQNALTAASTSYIKSNRKLAAFEFGFTTRTDDAWRNISLTRVLSNPVVLTNDAKDDQQTWPVLYYDFDKFLGYDSSGTNITNGSVTVALTLKRASDGAVRLYYLGGGSSASSTGTLKNLGDLSGSHTNWGESCGYYSFRDIMSGSNAWGADTSVSIIGVNIEYSIGGDNENIYTKDIATAKTTIRRLEVWQDQTTYVDAMYTENHYLNSNTTYAQLNDRIADGFNIVNDAFYSVHDERGDASSSPYRKQNSNKGWEAWIDVGDGTREYSREGYEKDGKFQYTSSVGNLRVWVPANSQGKVVFDSDRSFNTQNYKYLYYSYSMRNVATGIAAEDSGNSYVNISIRENMYANRGLTESSDTSGGNWTLSNVTTSGGRSVSGAIDLSTSGLESVNQIAFYLNNNESDTAEFYINYVYLSNVLPTDAIKKEMEKTQYQYYYLMDNTGDRYSARFPTIDNPTGQVTGTNSDNDRVNPIKVARGERLSTGTYFNDERLYGYGETDGTRVYNESTGSSGYYEKTYDNDANPNGVENGSMKNIMFYMGTSEELNDINDFYDYKDRGRIVTTKNADGTLTTYTLEPDGVANEYDMLWSYGRWFTGGGESGLNIMYIGDPALDQSATGTYTENGISGALVRRYATENYVLLRSGITPKTYTTYFDATGGEFLYDSSPDYIKNLQQVTENNYYVTSNTVLGYYKQPNLLDSMYGEIGASTDTFLKKPGYTFVRWDHYDYYGSLDADFNATENSARLATYIKKNEPGVDYFVAVWEPDPDYDGDTFTAYFYTDEAKATTANAAIESETTPEEPYRKITVGDEESTANDLNGRFVLTIPSNSIFYDGKTRTTIYGWKAVGDETGKVYSAGEKVYLLKETCFYPVTDATEGNTFNITLENAKLYVKTTNNRLQPVEKYGASLKIEGDKYLYSYVGENYLLTALPITVEQNYGWTEVSRTDGSKKYVVQAVTVLSDDPTGYSFTAHEDISIKYDSLIGTLKTQDSDFLTDEDDTNDANVSFYNKQNYSYVTTSTDLKEDQDNKQAVYFASQYELGENCFAVACGTMLTKDTFYDQYADNTERETTMRLNEATVTPDTVAKGTYKTMDTTAVRRLQATATNSVREYAAYIAHTKAEPITYYARGYLIYYTKDDIKTDEAGNYLTNEDGSYQVENYRVAYSDVIACGVGTPVTTSSTT